MSDHDQQLRQHLTHLLRGGDAHIHFDDLIKDFPTDSINKSIDGVPYTPWQVLEHIRIAQWDIIEFARNSGYISPPFPQGYWPAPETDATIEMWNVAVDEIKADLEAIEGIVNNPSVDLFARIPHADGQTWLRQALLIADHNAYHLGTLTLLKRQLSA